VRPGRYRLHVFGPGITPINQVVVVPDKGLDLGRLTAQGTGSIFGRVSSPPPREGKPWPFAGLVVWFTDFLAVLGQEHLWPIGCRADENGEFRIDGVPVGWVSVLVPYEVSADSSDAYVRKARVLEGQVTEVRFFDPERAWDVAFEFTVGDGSEAHWLSGAAMGRGPRVRNGAPASLLVDYELSPLGNEPVSFIGSARDRLVQRGVIVAPDTHPGKYRVRFDCDGLLEPFYEAVIDVTPYMDVVDVHLPAGSITGRIEAAHQRAKRTRVFAVSGHGGGYVRRGACDAFADFFLAFLPPDDYTVYAWDPEHGWCRFGPISIADNRVDVGERQLAGGGTIQGSLPETSGRSCELYVTDASGVETLAEDSVNLDAREFVVRHLWPGEWALTLRDGEQTVATASVALQGTETVHVDLRRE